MLPGTPVTVPSPVPALAAVNISPLSVKVAVTAAVWLIGTTHHPQPAHGPLQPVKLVPIASVAVSVTTVPYSYAWSHAPPQSMPGGWLVTCPFPFPANPTVSV